MSAPVFTLSRSMPQDWDDRCGRHGNLMHGGDWQQVLSRGLGCNTVYVDHPDDGMASVINVFRAGPFRVGYIAYPAGGTLDHSPITAVWLTQAARHIAAAGVDLLRIPCSGFAESPAHDLRVHSVPETAIPDVQTWSVEALPAKMRRDILRGRRCGGTVMPADERDVDDIYRLYALAVHRHGGHQRYTRAYFGALMQLASTCSRLRVFIGRIDGRAVAFIVTALHGRSGYYLHGGFDTDFASAYPSYPLLETAIAWARDNGAAIFNMMSSPADQPKLVRFKEKWGGVTRTHHTYEWPAHLIRGGLFLKAEGCWRWWRRVVERR